MASAYLYMISGAALTVAAVALAPGQGARSDGKPPFKNAKPREQANSRQGFIHRSDGRNP